MKKASVFLSFLLAAVLLLAGCATLHTSRDESSVQRVAALINQGRAGELARMSELPFLVDQEIVVLRRDVDALWASIVQAGYRVEEPALESGAAVGSDSYRTFYDSFEVKTYFKKYLKKNTRMLTLATGSGQRLTLLVTCGPGGRTIHGFKGPY